MLGTLLGYAIVAALFATPIAALLLAMRTRWFKRGHRVRWAGERLVHWRDPMTDLPEPFGDEPSPRRR